jgi:rubredoxin
VAISIRRFAANRKMVFRRVQNLTIYRMIISCPLCDFEARGKIGSWGFEEWHSTKYICAICGYVYDEEHGEPHRGIKPVTKFDDLPDNYVCPVCALDPKIDI